MAKELPRFSVRLFSVSKIKESVHGDVGAWPVLGLGLRQRQERAILWAGGSWAAEGEAAQVWIREDAFVSEDALKLFVQLLHKKERRDVPVYWNPIGDLGTLQSRVMFENVEPLLYWMPQPTTEPDFTAAEPFDVEPKYHPFQLEVPKEQFGVDVITIPLTDYVVVPTLHWLQLLWANFIGLGPFLWREVGGRNAGWIAWRVILSFFRTWSFRPLRLALGVRRIGKKCNIHPTAVVEASWIGDNVQIGAHAVVRGSVVADGARIEDLAMVECSILDESVVVQRQAMVKFSLLCRKSSVGGVIQMGVMDAGASLKRGAYLMDMSLGAMQTKVMVDGELREAPIGIAGCFVGSGTQIGLGVQVAPGRTIPSGIVVTASPQHVLRKIPSIEQEEEPVSLYVSEGTLHRHG